MKGEERGNMNLGNKISSLRKKSSLSQEELGELVGVTRQTISKWELGETSPDIRQAKELSKIFKVSLDELVNNDVGSILVEKVSNTERLAGLTIKILRVIGVLLIAMFVLGIVIFITANFNLSRVRSKKVVGAYVLTCSIDDEKYLYEVEYNDDYQVINSGGDAFVANHIDITNYEDANQVVAHIEDYFGDHNGNCVVKED